jgi:hypothetical protein
LLEALAREVHHLRDIWPGDNATVPRKMHRAKARR